MVLLQRYVFGRMLAAFASTLFIVTAIIWSTQALQRLDLVTAQGQTIRTFFSLTVLAVPFLATLIAPIAFAIAMVAIYDALNRENELLVASTSGGSRLTLLKPAAVLAVLVGAAIAVSVMFVAPAGLKGLRTAITEVRADVIATIVDPGKFISIEDGLVVHIRDRASDGTLEGLMLSDERDPARAMTYVARTGRVVEALERTLLVMTDGVIQRLDRSSGELSVAEFEAYAFDLTHLVPEDVRPVYKPSERTLPELLAPAADDAYFAEHAERFRAELHDRIVQPLYPLVFALVAFVFVGDPTTNRRGRMAGILAAGLAIGAVRLAGYAAGTVSATTPEAIALVYAVPIVSGLAAFAVIASDQRVAIHDRMADGLTRLGQRLAGAGGDPRRGRAATGGRAG